MGEGACGTLATDANAVVAISVVVTDSVKTADTLRPHATAVTARGDSVPAPFVWTSFDTTILALSDSTAGVFVGRKIGTASLQVRTGNLRSNPIPIRVTAP